ncbi:MAG: hypothetical protein ACT4QB_10720 [Gammaproteobacteria bacterium]
MDAIIVPVSVLVVTCYFLLLIRVPVNFRIPDTMLDNGVFYFARAVQSPRVIANGHNLRFFNSGATGTLLLVASLCTGGQAASSIPSRSDK